MTIFRGIVYREDGYQRDCGHRHRRDQLARGCALALAKQLVREGHDVRGIGVHRKGPKRDAWYAVPRRK